MTHLSQAFSALGAGIAFSALILVVARRGMLSMRYTMGWLFVAMCLAGSGLLLGLLEPLARALGVEPAAVAATAGIVGLLGITLQLSITVSGLMEAVRTLTEAVAMHDARLRAGEPSSVHPAVSQGEGPPEKPFDTHGDGAST